MDKQFVIRSKQGKTFSACEIGKTGEETYPSYDAAEKALKDINTIFTFKNDEFYIIELAKDQMELWLCQK